MTTEVANVIVPSVIKSSSKTQVTYDCPKNRHWALGEFKDVLMHAEVNGAPISTTLSIDKAENITLVIPTAPEEISRIPQFKAAVERVAIGFTSTTCDFWAGFGVAASWAIPVILGAAIAWPFLLILIGSLTFTLIFTLLRYS